MLFQTHHEGMNPGVEDDIGAFESHLRRTARWIILYMRGRGNHRARQPQSLGDVPLHLCAEHQVRRELGDLGLDREIVVADQGLDAVARGSLAYFAAEFPGVSSKASHREAEFVTGDARRGDCMGRIAEHEDPLAGEVSRVDRAGIPFRA